MPPRLFLIRHGAVENPAGIRYGCLPGFPLSAEGRAQAAGAASRLAARSPHRPLLLSSPLLRAAQTAEIVARHLELPVHTEPRLREIGSSLDGLPWGFAPLLSLQRRLDPARRGQDEPLPLAAARILAVVRDTSQTHPGDIVLVSHQLPLRAALLALSRGLGALEGPLPSSWWLRLRQPINPGYAQVFELVSRGRRWEIAAG